MGVKAYGLISMRKICSDCGKEKTLETEFYKNKHNPDGYAYQCKECRKEYNQRTRGAALQRIVDARTALYNMSHNELCDMIAYDKETGVLYYRNGDSVPVSINPEGYQRVYINKAPIGVHRLAFFIVEGRWPKIVDHIDGNTGNNKWINLRESSVRENGYNRIEHRKGKMLGVTYTKRTGKWQAQITELDGKQHSLGYYSTEYEAALAYARYALKGGITPRKYLNFTDKELGIE